jgi:3-phenylpropionate/trans-cinnamate dioxygenase ferredoxin reductase component
MPEQTFVIAGAGLAGAKAADTLRAEGFDGRVVLVGAEFERPYERPPLSKDYLRGEADRDAAYVHPPGFYDEQEIELRTGCHVTSLDPGRRRLGLDDGEQLGFDALLLATGAEPRRLRIPGAELDGVRYLRTLADSDALRERLATAGQVVVVGGGWIGCEVAASARALGRPVTLIEPLEVPLERVLGREIGAVFAGLHADHGVRLLLGTGAVAFEGAGRVERVVTTSGDTIDADLVVVGVGARPRTELAAGAGLDVGDGILVDGRLQTDAPGIFAAGDVAAHQHPALGRLRVEHWHNALEQGPAAARAMLGATIAYARLPYFFSDQYDAGMEYAGHAPAWDCLVLRGDPAEREFVAFWLREGRVLAGMNFNVWEVTDDIQALIAAGGPVDERRLADPDVPLADLAATPLTSKETAP